MKHFSLIGVVLLLAGTAYSAEWTISLDRTECYGTCPSYKVTIFSNGKVLYEGRKFVKTSGRASGRLSPSQIRDLTNALTQARYFSLRSSYASGRDGCLTIATDSPRVTTGVRLGKKRKKIDHYRGCHSGTEQFNSELQRLATFEDRIDEIIDIKQWIGTDEERSKFTLSKRLSHLVQTTTPSIAFDYARI